MFTCSVSKIVYSTLPGQKIYCIYEYITSQAQTEKGCKYSTIYSHPLFFSFYSLPTHPQKNWIFYSHSYSAFIISLGVFLVGWVVMGYTRTLSHLHVAVLRKHTNAVIQNMVSNFEYIER